MKPPEQVKRELVRQWLAKAEGDLKAAEVLLRHEDEAIFFTVGFHA